MERHYRPVTGNHTEREPELNLTEDFRLPSVNLDPLATDPKETIEIPVTIENNDRPTTHLIFFRHGQHLTIEDGGLNEEGIKEMRALGESFAVNEMQSIAFYANNLRTFTSALLTLYPDIDSGSLEKIAKNTNIRNKVKELSSLTYKSIREGEFKEGLANAVTQNKVLRFLVHKSDAYAVHTAEASTYKNISYNMAGLIRKYVRVGEAWKNLNERKEFEDKNLYRLFCGREFIFATFRACLTEAVLGKEARDSFLDNYERADTDENRRNIIRISITLADDNSANLVLDDGYGKLFFDTYVLDAIMEKMNTRTAAYIIPYRNSESGLEVALLKYPDGFGFIGGRSQVNETPKESLAREVREELGIPLSLLGELTSIDKNYEFEMAKGSRSDDPMKHEEQHHFFLAATSSKISLEFIESGAEVIWMPVELLQDDSVITFPELRDYIAESITPKLQKF